MHVLDGERITVPSVSSAELTLEVGAPASVGHVGHSIGSARVPTPGSPASLGHEIVTTQDVVDRGARGQDELSSVLLEVPPDLLRTVVGVGTSHPEDGLDDFARRRPGAVLGSTRSVPQSFGTVRSPAVQPLVAGLPADPVVLAEPSETVQTPVSVLDKAGSFVHDISLRERHRSPPVGVPTVTQVS